MSALASEIGRRCRVKARLLTACVGDCLSAAVPVATEVWARAFLSGCSQEVAREPKAERVASAQLVERSDPGLPLFSLQSVRPAPGWHLAAPRGWPPVPGLP